MEKVTIYRIECTANGKIYVGMAANYESRRHYHLHQLFAGRHPTKALQLDFNDYGEAGLLFAPSREVPKQGARAEELEEMRSLSQAGHYSTSQKSIGNDRAGYSGRPAGRANSCLTGPMSFTPLQKPRKS